MIHRAADLLNISPLALSQDLRREQRKKRPASRAAEKAVPEPSPVKIRPKEEISLLELLVHYYHDVHPLVHDYLPSGCLTDPGCRNLVELLMVDLPETLTETFHEFDEETQRVISRVQVEESRTIDDESSAIEIVKRYILLFWKRKLDVEQHELTRRSDLSNEERFRQSTRMRHDQHALVQGWAQALPMIEARLNTDV